KKRSLDYAALGAASLGMTEERNLSILLLKSFPFSSRIIWRMDHGRTRTALALQAGIRRAGLRTVPGRRHQPRPGRHLRGRPQHDRQLAAQTSRVRPGGA